VYLGTGARATVTPWGNRWSCAIVRHLRAGRRLKTNPSIAIICSRYDACSARGSGVEYLWLIAHPVGTVQGGQDVIRQVKAATDEVDKDISVRNTSLQTERKLLQVRLAVISPQFRAKEIKDFDAKQKNLQDLSRQKQAMIQTGFIKARSHICYCLSHSSVS